MKALYGMADEMLTKNFLEDKKTQQKNLFEREVETSKGQTVMNYEEVIESLKDQLNEFDFILEY